MKTTYLLVTFALAFATAMGQNANTTPQQAHSIKLPANYQPQQAVAQGVFTPSQAYYLTQRKKLANFSVMSSDAGLPTVIKASLKMPNASLNEQTFEYLNVLKDAMQIKDPSHEFVITKTYQNETGQTLVRLKQVYEGVDVYDADIILISDKGTINMMNGRYFRTPQGINTTPTLTSTQAQQVVKSQFADYHPFVPAGNWVSMIQTESGVDLEIFHKDFTSEPQLAWHVTYQPDILHTWEFYIDAQNGQVLRKIDRACSFAPMPPATGTGTDINGASRTVNSFSVGSTFYMVDASEPMFNAAASNMPNSPAGAIWVLDWNNQPSGSDNNVTQITSNSSNFSNPKAVSAFYNAFTSYNYYKNTFGRNSIDGHGGNIISFINVADDNGSSMDNAFWNGQYMFYGNGNQVFTKPLQAALDVGGHEMTHGVVQNTANLEYLNESGAMNESFADVFGCMIDRNNWTLGEGLTNTNFISTGVLRDMTNPHNGQPTNGNGWQPANMNEKYTGSQDNGGVHINSGICNLAFYLFANDANVGKANAEKVYYHALSTHLVKSSQFSDLRVAVLNSIQDLFAGNTNMINAACSAFDAVGISGPCSGGSTVDTHEDNLPGNTGNDYLLYVNAADNNRLYLANTDGSNPNLLSNNPVLSRPSVTDDGHYIVFVGQDHHIRLLTLDWANNTLTEDTLSANPEWRNAIVSKDGNRLAGLTTVKDSTIEVFDFTGSSIQQAVFPLYRPTFSQGVKGGGVQYAESMEWDYTSQWIMYDDSNAINSNGTNIGFWNIDFIHAWGQNNFADGNIQSLFSNLPDSIDVGNPVFARNSQYIVGFDYAVNGSSGTNYGTDGANTETGDVGGIIFNDQVGFPCYSKNDDKIVFNTDNGSNPILQTITMASDKINSQSSAQPVTVANNAYFGVYIVNGSRQLPTFVPSISKSSQQVSIYPNPFNNQVVIQVKEANDEANVIVTNVQGQEVYTEQLAAGTVNKTIDLSQLSSGVYFMHYRSGTLDKTTKIVKM